MNKQKIDDILSGFPEVKGNLIGILHEIQHSFRYLPEAELSYLSEKTGVPITRIYSIAHFFNRFSLTPTGEHKVCICLGTACHVKGGTRLLRQAERELKVTEGETTRDMKFTIEVVRCIGACSLAPAVMIDDQTYSGVSPSQISDLLHSLKEWKE